jgi:hypothetical protein
MAKMFYTMDETKAALNRSEDEIRQLSKDGKLREFRDGPRLMFKADQVESLKGELTGGEGGDQINLAAGDTHAPMGLMDSKSGSGSGTGELDLKIAETPAGGTPGEKDDTAHDVGLSGSLSGSIGGGSLAGSIGGGSLAGSMGGSVGGSQAGIPSPSSSRTGGRQGVNVFGDGDEHTEQQADPMAQTHITPPKDQISLEGVGSGSGLLDLTRETDDTSLGAALLDEISPGGKSASSAGILPPSESDSTAGGMTSISQMETAEVPAEQPTFAATPMMVEAKDPMAPAFAAASLGGAVMVLLCGFVLVNAIVNDNPLVDRRFDVIKQLANPNGLWMVFGAGIALAIILFFVGMLAGKGSARTA